MAEKEYVLNGIKFASAAEYQNAKKELEGIAYIRQKNDMSDDRVVLNMYNKFIQKNVFRTQIGYDFLKELQERLMRSTVINKSEVMKLPIYEEPEEIVLDASAVKEVNEPVKKQAGTATAIKNVNARVAVHNTTGTGKAAASKAKSNIHMEYVTKKPKQSESDKKLAEYKSKYNWSLFINIVLLIVIAVMVYITLNSKNINILNYEERLQNEYAAWAEELADREAELNRRERELNAKTEN